MSPQIDLNSDLESIIKAKLEFHKSEIKEKYNQIKEHNKQIANLQEYLKTPLNGAINQSFTTNSIVTNSDEDRRFKPSYWEPIVLDILSKEDRPLKTEDILKIHNPSDIDENRKRYIIAISACLARLVNINKVSSKKEEGKKGYYYTLINNEGNTENIIMKEDIEEIST